MHYNRFVQKCHRSSFYLIGQTHYKMISCNIWLPRANFYENIFYNAFALFYLRTNEFFYHESVIFIYKNRKNYFAASITFQNAFVVLKLLKISGYFVF